MKKTQVKKPKPNKTKIQLKIKSKNVTNNFILTPRAISPSDPRDIFQKVNRYEEELKSDRQKIQQNGLQKQLKEGRKHQIRKIHTDNIKVNFKRSSEEDQTGTHTPLVKRVSMTTESMNKKKSYNSLMSSQKGLMRKTTSDKFSKSESNELNKLMLQRVIGIIIKDYKDGKLRQKQLEETLVELYDRRNRKKSVSKKSSKKYTGFSNDFFKSAAHQSKNPSTARKQKQNNQDQEITQRVLERQGFVNKIIVKGITTSMFLKDDVESSNIRENQKTKKCRQPSFNIHTSNSIKQINEEMKFIQQRYKNLSFDKQCTLEDAMAIKIQRAWRRYCTRKLLKNIASHEQHPNYYHIQDQFTDEECNGQVNEQPKVFVKSQCNEAQINAASQYEQLVKMVSESLQSKVMSKQQCLKNILNYLNIPIQNVIFPPVKIDENVSNKSSELCIDMKEQQNQDDKQQIQYQTIRSRVKILKEQPQKQLYQQNSVNSEANSFTNKYSSKDVVTNNQFYKDKSFIDECSQIDKSLTFTHSQTMAAESFKMINIQNIQEGLQSRQQLINLKKQKQIEQLTQKLFNNKLTRDQYQQQKQKIDKWFKSQKKQLKKVKNSLLKSCHEARKILQDQTSVLKIQKSRKMLKCLSDKYIKKQNWALNINNLNENKIINQYKTMKCQQKQISQNSQQIHKPIINMKSVENENDSQQLVFNENDNIQGDWQENRLQVSPKLSRHTSLQQQNDYKYQQIQKVISEEDEGIQQGMIKFQQKGFFQSEKFIQNIQPFQEQIEEHQISLINNLINQQKKRFKYLCTEDKQDIFQFLFLDLVLQMFTQVMVGQCKILRAAEVYISKAKKLKKIPKGIKTNIAASKQYLKIVLKHITSKQNNLRNLSIPMGPSAIQMLKYMRDQIIQADDEQSLSSTLVIPLEHFQRLTKLPQLQLKLQRYYQDQQKQLNRLSFLKTALNINNKSLFDALNEMLDHQRPYGIWGKPFPWKKALAIDRKWSKQQEDRKIKKCIQKTIQSCSYLCGIIVDKQDSLFGTHRVSQQYVMQIRQDRLSKMLASQLMQNEQRWIFYDDQQTQILMEISSFITKKLIKEIVLQIISIRMKF